MHTHAVEEYAIDDGWQADVTDDVEPLSYRHESEDGDAHTNIGSLMGRSFIQRTYSKQPKGADE